jgi:hypothetical protein
VGGGETTTFVAVAVPHGSLPTTGKYLLIFADMKPADVGDASRVGKYLHKNILLITRVLKGRKRTQAY